MEDEAHSANGILGLAIYHTLWTPILDAAGKSTQPLTLLDMFKTDYEHKFSTT